MKKNLKKIGMFIFLLFAGLIFMTACSSDPTKISDTNAKTLVDNATKYINEKYGREVVGGEDSRVTQIQIYYDRSRERYIVRFDDGTISMIKVAIQQEKGNFKDFISVKSESQVYDLLKETPIKTLDVEKE